MLLTNSQITTHIHRLGPEIRLTDCTDSSIELCI